MNPYEVLGLADGAPMDHIRAAYRKMCRIYHPDVSTLPDREEKMRLINEAWAILSDPERKLKFDTTGVASQGQPIEQEAQNLLAMMFSSAIDQDVPNLVETVTALLSENLNNQNQCIVQALMRIQKLEAQSKRIRSKSMGDTHIVASLISDKLKMARSQVADGQHKIQVLNTAKSQVADFEFIAPPETMYPASSLHTWNSTGTTIFFNGKMP